jgi:hypothetical protein
MSVNNSLLISTVLKQLLSADGPKSVPFLVGPENIAVLSGARNLL